MKRIDAREPEQPRMRTSTPVRQGRAVDPVLPPEARAYLTPYYPGWNVFWATLAIWTALWGIPIAVILWKWAL